MAKFLGQGECFMGALRRLVRISKIPQIMRCKGPADHPGIIDRQRELESMVLRHVQGGSLLQVLQGFGKPSQVRRGDPERMVGLVQEDRSWPRLRMSEESLAECMRRLQLRTHMVIDPQPQ
jgi:hypothetical protein